MAKKIDVETTQVHELLYQSLETELGGVQVYETALRCAVNEDLAKEWTKYHEETQRHVEIMTRVCESLGLDTATMTPGREVVRFQGEALVRSMEMALEAGDPAAAELVACECVVLAETKDHSNWELIGKVAEKMADGDAAKVLRQAYEAVEQEEDHHIYHTKGWCRELWLQSLGLPAVVPPPEEVKNVETAIGASRAEQARDQMRPQ